MRAIIRNADYLKAITLKFKTFNYKKISKIVYNFVYVGAILPAYGKGEVTPRGEKFFYNDIFRMNT